MWLFFHVSFTLFSFLLCGISDVHLHCIFFNSDIFWHVRSKTTQNPELKYRPHSEIMCVLLLHFLPTMSIFCLLLWPWLHAGVVLLQNCLNSNIIFPTSESYFRAHEFACKARSVLPWASLDTGISSVIYHQDIQYLVTHFGPFSNEFHLIQSTTKTT